MVATWLENGVALVKQIVVVKNQAFKNSVSGSLTNLSP